MKEDSYQRSKKNDNILRRFRNWIKQANICIYEFPEREKKWKEVTYSVYYLKLSKPGEKEIGIKNQENPKTIK